MFQARYAQLTDVDLAGMTISYSGNKVAIPFEPPMTSMREARERLVQMDQDARHALGRSSIAITEFIPCYTHLGHLLNFTVCITTMVAFCRASNFQPGSLLYDNVLYMVPRFASFCLKIQPYLFPIMLSIHLFEAPIMAKRMKKHGVAPFERLWWLWMGTCFVEGVTSFWRLDGWIAEKRKEKESKKH
jgi:hypothetical protein